jgi:hypothetical protein
MLGYARYQTPGQCYAAVRRMVDFYWRDKRPDTLIYDPSRTKLSPSGLDSARICTARFDVATLPASQLASMLSLALWTQQPTLVTQVMRRLRAPQPSLTPEGRAMMLRKAGMAFLEARPANVDSAVAVRDLLRPLEPAAGIDELFLTNAITQFAMRLDLRDVAAASSRHAVQMLQPGRMTADDRTDYFLALLDMELYSVQIASRNAGITRDAIYTMFDSAIMAVKHVSGAAPDEIGGRLLYRRSPYELFQKPPTAPVRATYLYGDTTAPSLPRPGIVTLVYTGGMAAQWDGMATNAVLRRLHATFGAQGFAEVYLTATNGYFFNQLLAKPSDEAELIRKYFLEYQALPATLAIERSYMNTNATGLRTSEAASNQSAYLFLNNYVNCEVIGKDGTLKFFGWLTPETERTFAAAIRDALAEKPTSPDANHAK